MRAVNGLKVLPIPAKSNPNSPSPLQGKIDKRPDPEFPPAADQNHLDQGAHERWGSFDNGASVGLFRHEDESVSPHFIEHVTIYPAR